MVSWPPQGSLQIALAKACAVCLLWVPAANCWWCHPWAAWWWVVCLVVSDIILQWERESVGDFHGTYNFNSGKCLDMFGFVWNFQVDPQHLHTIIYLWTLLSLSRWPQLAQLEVIQCYPLFGITIPHCQPVHHAASCSPFFKGNSAGILKKEKVYSHGSHEIHHQTIPKKAI